MLDRIYVIGTLRAIDYKILKRKKKVYQEYFEENYNKIINQIQEPQKEFKL